MQARACSRCFYRRCACEEAAAQRPALPAQIGSAADILWRGKDQKFNSFEFVIETASVNTLLQSPDTGHLAPFAGFAAAGIQEAAFLVWIAYEKLQIRLREICPHFSKASRIIPKKNGISPFKTWLLSY